MHRVRSLHGIGRVPELIPHKNLICCGQVELQTLQSAPNILRLSGLKWDGSDCIYIEDHIRQGAHMAISAAHENDGEVALYSILAPETSEPHWRVQRRVHLHGNVQTRTIAKWGLSGWSEARPLTKRKLALHPSAGGTLEVLTGGSWRTFDVQGAEAVQNVVIAQEAVEELLHEEAARRRSKSRSRRKSANDKKANHGIVENALAENAVPLTTQSLLLTEKLATEVVPGAQPFPDRGQCETPPKLESACTTHWHRSLVLEGTHVVDNIKCGDIISQPQFCAKVESGALGLAMSHEVVGDNSASGATLNEVQARPWKKGEENKGVNVVRMTSREHTSQMENVDDAWLHYKRAPLAPTIPRDAGASEVRTTSREHTSQIQNVDAAWLHYKNAPLAPTIPTDAEPRLEVGTEIMACFYGEWHPAQVRRIEGDTVEVLWDSEWSISLLPISNILLRAPK